MPTHDDVRAWLAAGNSHDPQQILDLASDDFVMHQPQNPEPLDAQKLVSFFTMLWSALPDIKFNSIGITIEGDTAASWERVTATMTGPMTDVATGKVIQPTGKSFDVEAAMRLVYNDKNQLKEAWIFWDRITLYQQLGILKEIVEGIPS
ncbi:ester cyclase [Flexivirga meconopsidis]|uniref:ester cyclase n=1 Tax=Flexivirga meconopsidis TaxID=2977121 RepID=UPI00223ED218|nr:ester cyclase [Flexivirga meconopsidis]